MRTILFCTFIALSGCTTIKTVEVAVPVPTMPDAPEILVEPPILKTPRFGPPDMVESIVCLDQRNIEVLKEMTAELVAREKAWRAWYTEQKSPQ